MELDPSRIKGIAKIQISFLFRPVVIQIISHLLYYAKTNLKSLIYRAHCYEQCFRILPELILLVLPL